MNKNSKEIAESLADQVFKTLRKDISKGKIMLPEDDKQHQLPPLSKSVVSKSDQKQQAKLHEIVRKRKMLQEQLQRIKYDEVVVKQKIPHPMKESEEGKTKYFRSKITKQQKDKIKKVLKDTEKFEKSLTMKNEELEKKIKQLLQQERVEKEKIDMQRHQRKKKQVNENLKQIENRKKERAKQINEANKEFQRVSKMKFLHEAIQQKWKMQKKAEEQENEKFLQKNREEKKFKIIQIKEHARRYSQIVGNNKQKRQKNEEVLRQSLINQSRLARHSYSTFFQTINQEETFKKQTEEEKANFEKMRLKKKQMYAETVRQKHMSSFKPDSSPKNAQSLTTTDIRTSRSLDNLGLNRLGNDYMKQIHSCIGQSAIPPINKSRPKLQNKKQQMQKYTDYLTKARLQRKFKNPEDQPLQMKQLKAIIKKRDEDKQIRLYKAKEIVSKLDEKADGSSKNMIKSIMAKLSLIEQFGQLK